jgi:hypothetical protein
MVSPKAVGEGTQEKESMRIDKEREVWEAFRDEFYEGEPQKCSL